MNPDICSECNVCEEFTPVQKNKRILFTPHSERPVSILVIDDAPSYVIYDKAMSILFDLLGRIDYDYTLSIRCKCEPFKMSKEALNAVTSRCAVWTKVVVVSSDYSLVLSTKRGLMQLKVGDDKREGDLFRAGKVSVILCIPPVLSIPRDSLEMYRTKTKRALKESGLER